MTTKKLKQAFASAPAEEIIIETLQLSHSRFSDTWYLSSNVSEFDAKLESGATVKFTPLPFTVKLPASDAQGGQLLDISIANAGQEMVDEIEAAAAAPNERIEVVYRVYLQSDKTMPQNLPLKLSLDNIVMTDEAIRATAGRSDVLNFKFPNLVYATGVNGFPGLDR
jgi:Domain of unknown function (DUF1833)